MLTTRRLRCGRDEHRNANNKKEKEKRKKKQETKEKSADARDEGADFFADY